MALGERIKLARRMAGLSQRDLAANAEVSAQAISKYEREQDVPGSPVLLRLASALNVRLDYLLRPPSPLGAITPEYRKHPSLSRKQEDAIQAQVRDWLERYQEVEDLIGEARVFEWPAGFPRPAGAPLEAEQAADALRDAWCLGTDAIENMTEILEDRGIKVGVIADAPTTWDACSFRVDATDAPVIAVSNAFPGDRQRFSLAHELAHLALDIPSGVDSEAIANRFAGAFLVPASCVRAELGKSRHDLHLGELDLLKHKYGASMQSWIHRAEDLGVLSHHVAERLFTTFRAKGWRETEPGTPYPTEIPTRMKRLVLRALAEDAITESRAAELLGMPADQFRRTLAEVYVSHPADHDSGQQHLD